MGNKVQKKGRKNMLQIFSKEKMSENKKILENLVLFLVLFIIVIIVMNVLNDENKESLKETSQVTAVNKILSEEKEQSLEDKLESILSYIDGAGKVEVLITYQTGTKQIPMYNVKQNTTVTQEADKSGGTRKTEETNQEQTIIFEENGNEKNPVITQMINPEIVGILVVAEGAGNLQVKENLMKAVEAALNIPSHRIQVFARKK